VKPNPIKSTDAQGQQRPLVLEAAELPLDGTATPIELAPAQRLTRDQRVEAISLDPPARGLALAGRAAP